jgi:hypothetical protein
MLKPALTLLVSLFALNAHASCYMIYAPDGSRAYQDTAPPFDVSLRSPALEALRARGGHLIIGDTEACLAFAPEVPLQTLPPLPLAVLSALAGGTGGGYGGDGGHEAAQEIRKLRQQQQFQADQAAIMAPSRGWYQEWKTDNALQDIHNDLSRLHTDRIIYGRGW